MNPSNEIGLPDFSRVNVNKLRDATLTPEVIFGYLAYLSELTKLLCGRGRELLSKEGTLTQSEFNELFDRVFGLWVDLWQQQAVQKLFYLTIEKGIASLAHALAQEQEPNKVMDLDEENPLRVWFDTIDYQLQPGRRLGIGSHGIKVEKSRELIEAMVPLAQCMRSPWVLQRIAANRFPGDETAQAAYVQANTNWQ